MRTRGLLATTLAVTVGLGCGTSEDEPCTPGCGAGFQCYFGVCIPGGDGGGTEASDVRDDGGGDDGTVPTPGKLDLLFVVDNSGSMAEEQALMTAGFPALVDALFDPPTGAPTYPAVTELNVGVISTDMGAGTFVVRTCNGSDDGLLQHVPSPSVAGCETSYPAFLQADTAVHGADFVRDFSCIATLGTEGCGFEQPLGAMDKALTVHARAGGPNAGFLRADAALAVVIVTDENDCSTEDPSIFDPAGTGLLALRCVTRVDQLTAVSHFAEMLDGLKPDGRLAVGMMVGVPPALAICNTTGDMIEPCLSDPLMHEEIDPASGVVRQVCENAETRAYPGVRFVQLAGRLGPRALVRSICDPQFDMFYQQLARMALTAR